MYQPLQLTTSISERLSTSTTLSLLLNTPQTPTSSFFSWHAGICLAHHPQVETETDIPCNYSLQFMTWICQFLSYFHRDYSFQGTFASQWQVSTWSHFSSFKYQWWQRLLAFRLRRSALLSKLWLWPLCPEGVSVKRTLLPIQLILFWIAFGQCKALSPLWV